MSMRSSRGAGDALLVFGYHGWRASAGLEGIAIVSAGAGIHTIGFVFLPQREMDMQFCGFFLRTQSCGILDKYSRQYLESNGYSIPLDAAAQ